MFQFPIVVVGASAGGVEALKRFVSLLPPNLDTAIFIVLHVSARGTSVLPDILTRAGRWPAVHAVDGMVIERGRIYVAPPDRHLLVHEHQLSVAKGPKENGHRPSVDPLFRSAAQHFGSAAIGIILSGSLDDGTSGLMALKQNGGTAIVQDPEDALYPGMPNSAIQSVDVDHILPLDNIPPLLESLIGRSSNNPPAATGDAVLDYENRVSEFDMDAIISDDKPGAPSFFSCPDCGGVLWELQDGDLSHYRCRVGHAWSGNSLLSDQSQRMENALWTALRALEERAVLSRRMARTAHLKHYESTAARYIAEAEMSEENAVLLRTLLLSRDTGPVDTEPEYELRTCDPAPGNGGAGKPGEDLQNSKPASD